MVAAGGSRRDRMGPALNHKDVILASERRVVRSARVVTLSLALNSQVNSHTRWW